MTLNYSDMINSDENKEEPKKDSEDIFLNNFINMRKQATDNLNSILSPPEEPKKIVLSLNDDSENEEEELLDDSNSSSHYTDLEQPKTNPVIRFDFENGVGEIPKETKEETTDDNLTNMIKTIQGGYDPNDSLDIMNDDYNSESVMADLDILLNPIQHSTPSDEIELEIDAEEYEDESVGVQEYEDTTPVQERDILTEIERLQLVEGLIPTFKNYNLKEVVSDFLNTSGKVTLTAEEYELKIKNLISVGISNKQIDSLFDILNLQENKKAMASEIVHIKSKLNTKYTSVKNGYVTERQNIINRINNYTGESINKLNELCNTEMDRLEEFEKNVREYLVARKQRVISEELSKHTELFEQVARLTSQVEEIRDKVTSILGKNYAQVTREKITIPTTNKELKSLLKKVDIEVDKLEMEDRSYYDKIMTKVMKFLFIPSRYTSNDMRSVMVLLNVAGFLYLTLKFRDIVVVAFTTTILIDLFNQVRMSKKNRNVDFLIEFAGKSTDIIEGITDNLVSDTSSEVDEEHNEILGVLETKVDQLISELEGQAETKETELTHLYDIQALIGSIDNKHERVLNAIDLEYKKILQNLENSKETVAREIDTRLQKAYKEASENENIDIYGDGNNGSLLFSTEVKVGRLVVEGGEYGCDFTRNFPEGSYLVNAEDDEEKEEALDKVKMIVLQHLSNIKTEFLTVNFIDTKEAGNDLIEMVSEHENITKLISSEDNVQEHLKHSIKQIETRYRVATKDYESITEYNRDMIEKNETTFKYEINVFYNFNKELVKNNHFRTLMSEGGKSGLTNIVFLTSEELLDQRGEEDRELISSLDCFDFSIYKDGKWKTDYGAKENIFKGTILPKVKYLDSEPIEFDRNLTLMKIRELEEIIEESKKETVLYKELESQYADELFTKTTLKGIEICVGFIDGNLTKPEYVTIGDSLVHAMMAGATGKGKSNTINVLLMNLIRTYSPEWLELYMIDFKNVEFNTYTQTVETPNFTKKVSAIPHTSLIAGTTDPEYSLSVFEKALKEMERRKRILSKGINHNGKNTVFKKIESYNTYVLENNLKDKYPIIPRILMLLDEFQVMFQMEDMDMLYKIKSYITRLAKEARAMGIHMFFTSQSMEGTLSDDVKGQFAMRFCLECTVETSKEVLGNDAANRLRGLGWLLMSGTMERKEEDNKLFKVPFIPEDHIARSLQEVRDTAKRLHENNPNIPYYATDFYDEKDLHQDKELKAYLENPNIKKQRNAMLLGSKVIYKDKSIPEHFMIGNDDTENVIVTANDKVSLANLINTLLENIASKENSRILIANYDRTLDGFLKEEYTFPGMEVFNRATDPMPLLESVLDLIGIESDEFDPDDDDDDDIEEVRFNPATDNRWYLVIVGLNKAAGFNEEYPLDEYMDPLTTILKEGPSKGLTTILNYKQPFRASKLLPQCAYRISGKVDDDFSYELFGGRKAKNLMAEEGVFFGLYRSTIDDSEHKFKIYNFDYAKELLQPKELEDVVI